MIPRRRIRFLLAALAFTATGCALPSTHPTSLDTWTTQQGGEVHDARLTRLTAIGNSLVDQCGCGPVHFHVLQNSALSAYSWPRGDVFLTAPLIDAASDDEIAAAVAHEFGHLLNDGHLHSPLSLRGPGAPGIEQHADQTATTLLRAAHRPTEALASVLQKVSAAAPPPENRAEIQARISTLLQAQAAETAAR